MPQSASGETAPSGFASVFPECIAIECQGSSIAPICARCLVLHTLYYDSQTLAIGLKSGLVAGHNRLYATWPNPLTIAIKLVE